MAAVSAARQLTVFGTAFALRDPWPWPALAGLARLGDELGYRAVLLPEIAGRDSFVALAGLAGETSQLLLGTGIVPMTSRRPALTAMAVATVHERSGGRAILGIGTGAPRPGALGELATQVAEIRSRLQAKLDDGADGSTLVLERPVPIWIAALGPRALMLAGALADGVLLNWCTPARVTEARHIVGEAALAAGRDPNAITVATYVRSAVEGGEPGDDERARRALAAASAEYASYPAYRRQFEAMGLGPAAGSAAAARAAGSEPVPETVAPLIDAVCASGKSSAARARLQAFRDAGCDLPVVYPVPFGEDREASVAHTLRMLAPDR